MILHGTVKLVLVPAEQPWVKVHETGGSSGGSKAHRRRSPCLSGRVQGKETSSFVSLSALQSSPKHFTPLCPAVWSNRIATSLWAPSPAAVVASSWCLESCVGSLPGHRSYPPLADLPPGLSGARPPVSCPPGTMPPRSLVHRNTTGWEAVAIVTALCLVILQ